MRWALLFSGQGSQTLAHVDYLVKHGSLLFKNDMFEHLSLVSMLSLSDSDTSALFQNDWAQPFIFAYQMTCWSLLKPLLPPPLCVGGYSLGEMSAAAVAGLFTVEQGMTLCRERARLMDLYTEFPCQMLAISGLSSSRKTELLQRFNLKESIRPSRQQSIVVGAIQDIRQAQDWAFTKGAKQSQLINVHTPSHTPWLWQAAKAFAQELSAFKSQTLSLPVMSAIDGEINYCAATVSDALSKQIDTPLDWQLCQELLLERQLDCVLEIGPGQSLSRFWMSQNSNVVMRSLDEFRSIDGVIRWMHQ